MQTYQEVHLPPLHRVLCQPCLLGLVYYVKQFGEQLSPRSPLHEVHEEQVLWQMQ